MANYANDQDLLKIRPNILGYGETDWEDMHVEAKSLVDRDIEVRWYREQVVEQTGTTIRTTPFDADRLDASQLKRLACFKALELIYRFLMQDSPDMDAFEKQMGIFQKLYDSELQSVLAMGVNYDWDLSGKIESTERMLPRIRRQQRM